MSVNLEQIKDDIKWFYKERDIERYGDLPEALELLPDLKLAYENYRLAKLALDKVIKDL